MSERRIITLDLEVRFADIDMMGHVNNAVYLSYFEQARIGYFNQILDEEWDWNKDGILVARNEVDYKRPIKLGDMPRVSVWCDDVGTKSFSMHYDIYTGSEKSKQLCTSGKSILVCFDYSSGKSMEVPKKLRDII